MKYTIAAMMMLSPRMAMAACDHGARACAQGCGHFAAVVLAATAALGCWVLRHAEKDSGAVRWAGRVTGWVLVVIGLLGFLCGSVNHMKRSAGGMAHCDHEVSEVREYSRSMDMMEMPPGHPPINGRAQSKPKSGK